MNPYELVTAMCNTANADYGRYKMKKYWLYLLVVLFFTGCDMDEANALNDQLGENTIWVFVQFNIPQKGRDYEDYYYYGKVNEQLYNRIKSNRIQSGFILMEDVMYWGNDDLIHDFEDGENEGDIVFRIEDIKKMDLVKTKPVAGKGSEQFENEPKEPAQPIGTIK
jgi:hypothetical protein